MSAGARAARHGATGAQLPARHAAGAATALLALLLCSLTPPAANAQVSVQNLLDFQAGNVPGRDPSNLTQTFDQADIQAFLDHVRFGARFEYDHNSLDRFSNQAFSQRWLELTDAGSRVRVGNLFTILGRGLLQRSFTLPGVVLTSEGTASRFGFMRDVDGVLVEQQAGPLALRGLSGRPNAGDISPGVAEEFGIPRYSGQLLGGQGALRVVRGASLGAAYTRLDPGTGKTNEYASGFGALDPLEAFGIQSVSLPIYAEYALGQSNLQDWVRFHAGDDRASALYASLGLVAGPFGGSAEWKDYHRFSLGVNDPPSLVREQSFALLNRTTHVLFAQDEEGYQLEGSWRFDALGNVVLNRSRSDGKLSISQPPRRYQETYLELHAAPGAWTWLDLTLFADGGRDEFVGIRRRETYGASARAPGPAAMEFVLDVEHQSTDRTGTTFVDRYASLSAQHPRWGTASLLWQHSTDPAEESPSDASSPGVQPRTWWGGSLSTRIGQRHDVALFAGQRREGLACTAGTCYKVEALDGVSLRISSRF